MKKLLVLTALMMLTAGTVGCRTCDWFRRGALFPTTTMVYPEMPACDPCAACDPGGVPVTSDPCAPAPYVTQPSTVLPGPAQ